MKSSHSYWRSVGEPGACASRSRSRGWRTSTCRCNIVEAASSTATTTARSTRWRRCRRSRSSRTTARQRDHPVAADPRVPRRALPRARRSCRRIRTCARARAQLAEIVNSGIQPLQNLVDDEAGQGVRRRRPRVWPRRSSPTGSRALEARRARRPARSASATRRRSPTAAWCRSSTSARRFERRPRRSSPLLARHRGALHGAARVPAARARPTVNPTRVKDEAMAKLESLGIKRLEGIHYYVHDLERSRRFYTRQARLRRDVAAARPSSRRSGKQQLGVLPGRQRQRRVQRAVGEGGRACALPRASTPTASARWSSRSRTSRRRSGCSTSAAARRSTTSRRFTRRRRHAAPVLDHHAVRRHARSASSSATAIARCSRASIAREPRRRQQQVRLQGDRPRHVELPDHEADAAVARARARLRAIWEVAVPHRATSTPTRKTGSGLQVDGDVGSRARA